MKAFEGSTPWAVAGNDRGVQNCAAVAIANHLRFHEGLMMSDEQIRDLAAHGTTIGGMLRWLTLNEVFRNVRPDKFRLVPVAGPGDLIVYNVDSVSHAALLLPDRRVVSWGEELPFREKITEAWSIQWRTFRQSGRPWQVS